MLKMTIDNEEVVSKNNFTIKEEMLSPSSTILNNTYPKTWEDDKDYTSRFYYPKDYAKLNIQNFSITPEEAGTTIQVNGSATLTDVDTTKESRVLRLLGQTSQTGTPTPSSPIPVNVVSGDNEINICGKNLFDKDNVRVGYRFDSEGEYYANTGYNATEYIGVQPSTLYSVSWSMVWDEVVCTYDINKNFVRRIISGTNFTTSASEYYIRADVSNAHLSTAQINEGNQVLPYEPYIGNTYTISLGDIELCKIGTYQDYIYKENGSWYLHKEIGKVVLDGTINWTLNQPATYVNQYLMSGTNLSEDVASGTANIMSDYFKYKQGNPTNTTNEDYMWLYQKKLVLDVRKTIVSDASGLKTWIGNNKPTIYYQLATPTTTEITDTTLISQLDALESQ